MPRHNSNEIEIQRKGRGTHEALRGAYIQGCEAVISHLKGGPNWFLPVAGADEKRKSGQAGGKRRGRGRSGFNILIKATRGFVAARRRWTFQAWTNGRPHTSHPPSPRAWLRHLNTTIPRRRSANTQCFSRPRGSPSPFLASVE